MLPWLVALAALLAAGPGPEPVVEAWVGHQVLEGKRKIPLYGNKDTHTENFLIAEIHRSAGHIDVTQKLCRIEVRPISGVVASMSKETVLRLPKSHPSFTVSGDGALAAQPWSSGWDAEDLDADGLPGVTVQISGSKCTGQVYVSNHSTTTLVAGHATSDGMAGEIKVQVKQKILGASGFCLKLLAGDSDETQTGRFAYRRVPIGTSCGSLADKPWPITAAPPATVK